MSKRSIVKDLGVLVLMLVASLACFWDVLWLNFFSDDYHVLYRLTIDKIFWAPGFFRPLSDLTLLFSYYTSGYDAFGFRLFNVLLHGINAFLLYKTLQHLLELKQPQKQAAAFIGAMLFVTYPFHTESITWIVGRASMVANFFGILSLYFFFSNLSYKAKIAASCACYFIGLASYESIIVIPGIIFFAAWYYTTWKKAFIAVLPYAVTLALHMVVRLTVAGVFAGNYGKDMFGENQTNYAAKFIKSFGRLFVPPLHNNLLLVVLFCLVFTVIIVSFVLVFRYRRRHLQFYILLWLFLLVAHILPTAFGIDTHTSDGDRLLYFPSYFLCAIVAFLLCITTSSKKIVVATSSLLVLANFYFLKRTNKNWVKADTAMTEVFNSIRQNASRPIYFINMPDAIEGSFVFRNGLYEALQIHNIPGDVRVINYLLYKDAMEHPQGILPVLQGDEGLRLPPAVTITLTAFKVDSLANGVPVTKQVKRDPAAAILYWNRNKVVSLLP
ncbi:hypothetical protein [Aridibaculum aurantiacum]|uniref:hypothetical protein n=1 Tax=Aridibaculum aurantiacum TaxID=2810307 RepID=UPI001A97A4E7|nr:hypothetical protein [Aridibaculum aurantiacum]